MTSLSGYIGSRELLTNLTMREVRGKYRRTALGHAWSLINPLASIAIFSLVFGFLLKANPPQGHPSGLNNYGLWLAVGLLPWTFFSGALAAGMQSLIVNAGLVKKVYFPREVLVSSAVFALVVTFSVEMGVLVVLLLIAGGQPLLWLPLVAVAVVLLTLFTLGMALLLAIGNVYFRDTGHLVAIGLQFWFYLTPVVYPPTLVDRVVAQHGGLHLFGVRVPVAHLYKANPMERFTSLFRSLLYDNALPTWQDWAGAVVVTLIALGLGFLVFRRFAGRIVEEL